MSERKSDLTVDQHLYATPPASEHEEAHYPECPHSQPCYCAGRTVKPSSASETVDAARQRLLGLREVRQAGNGWHDATALWSVENDLDWLLKYAEDSVDPYKEETDAAMNYGEGYQAGRAESDERVAALRRVEWDDENGWLVHTDDEGASEIVASNVRRWFGQAVAALDAAPEDADKP